MSDYVPPVTPNVDFVLGNADGPYVPPVTPHIVMVLGAVEGNPFAGTYDQSNYMLILTQ